MKELNRSSDVNRHQKVACRSNPLVPVFLFWMEVGVDWLVLPLSSPKHVQSLPNNVDSWSCQVFLWNYG